MRNWLPLLSILVLGCLETTSLTISSCPGPDFGNACGIWIADGMAPGASLVVNLRLQNGVLSGTGTYSLEGGRSGKLDLVGTYEAPAISMKLTYDYGFVAPFTGTLMVSQQIVGSYIDDSGQAVPLTFSLR